MARDKRIYNPWMVRSDLEDPSGFTPGNNPHPPNDIMIGYARLYNKGKSDDELDCFYFEYDLEGWHRVICHACLLRAKYGSGNCQDNGEYFYCLRNPEFVKSRQKRIDKYYGRKEKKTVQVKLI